MLVNHFFAEIAACYRLFFGFLPALGRAFFARRASAVLFSRGKLLPEGFRPVPSDECHLVHPYVTLGAALPEEHLPHPGEEPAGYIAVCCTGPENKVTDIDLGIAAQSMLLKAVDTGLNGIVILNFHAEAVMEALGLPSKPICLIAIGKGTERIFLVSARPGDSLSYYRKDGIHYVPKLSVDDLLI